MKIQTYSVNPIKRDPDIADAIQRKLDTVPNFLHGQSFYSLLSQPGSAFFTVDGAAPEGNGVVGAKEIIQGHYGIACMTFWDRKLEDKVVTAREVSRWVMSTAQLHFLSTSIPVSKKRQIKFVQDVGFKIYRPNLLDHNVYILLLEDL